MIIYELTRKDETLAIISPWFSLTPYYLMSTDISKNELALIETVAEDLCADDVDFEEYSKHFINNYKLKIFKKDLTTIYNIDKEKEGGKEKMNPQFTQMINENIPTEILIAYKNAITEELERRREEEIDKAVVEFKEAFDKLCEYNVDVYAKNVFDSKRVYISEFSCFEFD